MKSEFIFGRRNFVIMIVGLAVIAVGYLLMIGGGSDDPNVFNEAIFSPQRIVVAPTLILIGFAIEAYAIMYRDKSDSSSEQ